MTRISVVIQTYRRADLLERCLDALATQTLEQTDYEVIVADDAASKATREQVGRWHECAPNVRYVAVTDGPRGPAAARNIGWRVASGAIVAFTDDDTIPACDWLERAVARFDSGGVHAVSGRITVPLPPNPTDYERDAAGLEDAGFVTANCVVRRDVLESLGGFDERFARAWREDSDLYFRLLDGRYTVGHAEDVVVEHPVRPARWGASLQQQCKASYDALLYRKFPALYARHVRPGRPTMYYPTVFALVAMLVGAAAKQRDVTIAGAIAWIGLTAWFAAKRLRGTSHDPRHVAEMVVTSALIPPLSLFWRATGALRFRVWFL